MKKLPRTEFVHRAESELLAAHRLFLLGDDATVDGTRLAQAGCMAAQSLANRVEALEAKVGNKTLEVQFRQQAEMLDERFLLVDQRLDGLAADVRILKTDVSALKTDVSALKVDVSALRVDVNALKKDMSIVREGIGIILRKLP